MSKNKEKETQETEVETPQEEDTQVDVVVESDNTEEAETVAPEPELSEEEKLQNKVAELEDKVARKAAEFENYKKRTARQYDDMIKFANERTISEVLDVVDNFNRALSQKDENMTLESFSEGIQMIYNQLHAIIEKYDVKPIEAIGKKFDPDFHEALMHVESDEFEEGTVALEINKGYLMGDRVIRHSKVGVAKPKEVEETKNEEDNTENN